MIKQFLRDVTWGDLDYLVIDTPPGTSDEHLSITQYLKATAPDGAIILTTPQVRFASADRAKLATRKSHLPTSGRRLTSATRWACQCWASSKT